MRPREIYLRIVEGGFPYCTPHYNKASGEGLHGTLIVE
jgi:hypothetical protein